MLINQTCKKILLPLGVVLSLLSASSAFGGEYFSADKFSSPLTDIDISKLKLSCVDIVKINSDNKEEVKDEKENNKQLVKETSDDNVMRGKSCHPISVDNELKIIEPTEDSDIILQGESEIKSPQIDNDSNSIDN